MTGTDHIWIGLAHVRPNSSQAEGEPVDGHFAGAYMHVASYSEDRTQFEGEVRHYVEQHGYLLVELENVGTERYYNDADLFSDEIYAVVDDVRNTNCISVGTGYSYNVDDG